MSGWADPNWGVKPMEIEGPYKAVQARTDLRWDKYTDKDREWRNKWIRDQHFSSNDGRLDLSQNPDYMKARFNVFRRILRFPLDCYESVLSRVFHYRQASLYRNYASAAVFMTLTTWYFGYYALYYMDDWKRFGGWKISATKRAIYPGNPEWPHNSSQERTSPADYADYGFKDSFFFKKN